MVMIGSMGVSKPSLYGPPFSNSDKQKMFIQISKMVNRSKGKSDKDEFDIEVLGVIGSTVFLSSHKKRSQYQVFVQGIDNELPDMSDDVWAKLHNLYMVDYFRRSSCYKHLEEIYLINPAGIFKEMETLDGQTPPTRNP